MLSDSRARRLYTVESLNRMITTGNQWLREYAEHGSDAAFRELVSHYTDFVYAIAVRRVGSDFHLAQDIVQIVFTDLARKARQIPLDVMLGGWLHRHTCFVASIMIRGETRRRARERQAAEMNETCESSDSIWQKIAPQLDEAIDKLGSNDRQAIILRFLEQHDLRTVGTMLGISEDASQKRVSRALNKLRILLARRGAILSSTALGTILLGHSTGTAPAGVATALAGNAMAAGIGATNEGIPSFLALWRGVATKSFMRGTILMVALGTVAVALQQSLERANLRIVQSKGPDFSVALPRSNGIKTAAAPATGLGPRVELDARSGTTITFHALDAETGRPLEGIMFQANFFGPAGEMEGIELTTDAEGKCVFPKAIPVGRCGNVSVTPLRHVPKVIRFPREEILPDDYTVQLDLGMTIGGTVVNEQDKLVTNARIAFHPVDSDRPAREHINFHHRLSAFIASADGKWRTSLVPRSFKEITLVFTHPDYAMSRETIDLTSAQLTNLRIVLKPGITIKGTVVDDSNRPISEAVVREVHNFSPVIPKFSGATDPHGQFFFTGARPGDIQLVVEAKGYSPQLRTITVVTNLSWVKFEMARSHGLRARVINEADEPVAGALVRTAADRNDYIQKLDWEAKTDLDGRVHWDSAPNEGIPFLVLAEGYYTFSGSLAARAEEHKIQLQKIKDEQKQKTINIAGTVIDAHTKSPVERFKVLTGSRHAHNMAGDFDFAAEGKDGKFRIKLQAHGQTPLIQIEADGYLPEVSPPLKIDGEDLTVELELKKGRGPSGLVTLPDGSPVVGAQVCLSGAQSSVHVSQQVPGRLDPRLSRTPSVETDRRGYFSFKPTIDAQTVVTAHESGFAEVTVEELARNTNITVRPWGRVEGVVRIGKNTSAPQKVTLKTVHYQGTRDRSHPAFSFWYTVQADGQGRFIFEKVPPGECQVAYRVSGKPRSHLTPLGLSHSSVIQVQSGETTRVTLGGTGQTVHGRVTAPIIGIPIDWQWNIHALKSKFPELNSLIRPRRSDFPSVDHYVEAVEAFNIAEESYWNSPDGKARQRASREYTPIFSPDGSFRIDDVSPGKYELIINVTRPTTGALDSREAPVGSLTTEVIVPDLAGATDAAPLDLGTLELKVVPQN